MKKLFYLLLFLSGITLHAMMRECTDTTDIPDEYRTPRASQNMLQQPPQERRWWQSLVDLVASGFIRMGQVQHPDMYTADLSTALQDKELQPSKKNPSSTASVLRKK